MPATDVPADCGRLTDDECELTKRGKQLSEEACGTAFCRAGWMAAIMDPAIAKANPTNLDDMTAIYQPMRSLLVDAGCGEEAVEQLFGGGSGTIGYTWGTKAYAKAGAKGVKTFMKRYASELKAVKLVAGKKGRLLVESSIP